MTPELVAWLTADGHEVAGWESEPPAGELRCAGALIARLSEAGRSAERSIARAWVDGCPVLHHPDGAPLAYAWGDGALVARSGQPAGALTPATASTTSALDGAWVDLDPWATDTSFARTTELLRMHVRRAYELAEARAWR